jgi:hypothetical protein
MNNDPHARLHELFDEDPLEDSSSTETDADHTRESADAFDDLDRAVDDALSMTTLSALSPEAQELLVGLTDTSSSLEPTARQHLVAAADRGMRRRREDASALPRLLFVVRTREKQKLDVVAASLATDEEVLSKVERGESSVVDLGAEKVAHWIQHFGLSADFALKALELTFLHADANQAAAGTPQELSDDDHKFVSDVARLLQQG